MIRRAFWLGAGAAAGIMGYRRVSAIGRKVSGRLGDGTANRLTGRHAISAARETIRFTRDVREGMDLYIARHNGSARPTLGHADTNDQKDGH